ncbi:hypothetical protein [Mucilaginibacter sp.]|uniref:hypothetical protein n=1 Tax=Mucilaginibacter sp. TaxID=1882438 RepID=UPI0032662911
MIQINVVARISEDKNAFFDLIFAAHQLANQDINDVHILFIGDILSEALHRSMVKLIDLFDLAGRVKFTEKSIRFADLDEEVKDGYFINFTIGNFMGFSGIESINMGLKTLFYNPVKTLSTQTVPSPSLARDMPSLVALLARISNNQGEMDKLIATDNLKMKADFLLMSDDKAFLKSVLIPTQSN